MLSFTLSPGGPGGPASPCQTTVMQSAKSSVQTNSVSTLITNLNLQRLLFPVEFVCQVSPRSLKDDQQSHSKSNSLWVPETQEVLGVR